MNDIQYLFGDATRPESKGPKIIMHICNDIGAWGKGFVLAISKRWKEPEGVYRQISGRGDLELGSIQCIEVGNKISVINMIAQRGIRNNTIDEPPIRYDALRNCLKSVAILAKEKNKKIATEFLIDSKKLFTILDLTKQNVIDAIENRNKDFEDDLHHMVARNNAAKYIITRNKEDFKEGNIIIMTAEEFIKNP